MNLKSFVKDPRFGVALLLSLYCLMGTLFLGFSRKPSQILLLLGLGMVFELFLHRAVYKKWIVPISAYISCLSLSILLNFALSFYFLPLAAFIAIASKYLFRYRGHHVFNPSMAAICFCLWFGQGWINISPAYQWIGTTETSLAMSAFIITGSLFVFLIKINRLWLVGSFLIFYILQTALRAWVTRFHIPPETLFVASVTSPAFYLFTFFMITDPKTSPDSRGMQILSGFAIAVLDLYYHTQFSLYTFFYAGMTWAAAKWIFWVIKDIKRIGSHLRQCLEPWSKSLAYVALIGVPVLGSYVYGTGAIQKTRKVTFAFKEVLPEHTGILGPKGQVLENIDPRVKNVGKWVLSVGDAVAIADVDLDGLYDVFLTQPLKSKNWRGKLFLNQGNFRFQKHPIAGLSRYTDFETVHGLPSSGLFLDYDNDGDADLLVGFSFGYSRLFENRMVPEGSLSFAEKHIPFLDTHFTITTAIDALNFNGDPHLDLFVTNVLQTHLPGYAASTPLNIFHLPEPEYPGDKRMFHFMHESWHNSNNGGLNHLLLGGASSFHPLVSKDIGLPETRWSLAVGAGDFNDDGFTDLYIANDFGRDDCYLNRRSKGLSRQQGAFVEDIGLDTYKGMNCSIGDLDGNLKEDVYISNVHHAMQAEGSLLWLNYTKPGAEQVLFKERATQKGVLNPNRFGWGGVMADFDKDGWLDIYQANGMVSDKWDKLYEECVDYWYLNEKLARSSPGTHSYTNAWADIRGACVHPDEKDRVYLNHRGKYFKDVAETVGIHHEDNTRGAASVDLDNDGDLDLIVTNQFGPPKFFRNQTHNNHAWLGLKLQGNGTSCNSDAVSTKVKVSYQNPDSPESIRQQIREVRKLSGFSAQSDDRLFFGLGTTPSTTVKVEILWCGKEPFSRELAVNRYHRLKQGEGSL